MADFPEYKAGDIVSASHLNALSAIAKRYQGEVTDLGYGPSVPLQTMIIVSVILEPRDTDDDSDESSWSSSSSDSRSSVSHSASSSSKSSSSGVRTIWNDVRAYTALPLYYDHGSKAWLVNYTHIPYELDASAFHGQFKVGDTCLAFWDAARNAYIAQPQVGGGGTTTTSTGGGSTTTITGSCCCDEMNCLKITGYTGTIPVNSYTFSLAGFDCGCTTPGSTSVTLAQVDEEDDTVWESEVIRCVVPDGIVVAATATSTWSWSSGAWTLVSTTGFGCTTEPTFSGSVDGQTATTTCASTATGDGETVLGDFFWRLTIAEELDANGCDATTLELHAV